MVTKNCIQAPPRWFGLTIHLSQAFLPARVSEQRSVGPKIGLDIRGADSEKGKLLVGDPKPLLSALVQDKDQISRS